MSPDQAVELDNMFPRSNLVTVRNGHASHSTGYSDPVESLMPYLPPSGSAKLFAAAGASVFDATSAGAVGVAEFGSMSNARWQHVNFGNSSGQYLCMVNGADSYRYYNGSTWTIPTVTGVTSADLVSVNVFKQRLFFIEKESLSFWYFPVETLAGAITEFDVSAYCQLGGHLVAMGSWSRDGGDGIDDLAVFITSMGEALLYKGTDPSSASTWSLVGVFRIGPPIGLRCLVKIGSELVIITRDGFTPISRAISTARTQSNAAISDRIRDAVTSAGNDFGDNWGWQPVFYPRGQMAVFNVPVTENSKAYQYVANTNTGAWCRFTGMDANAWAVFNNDLYFGGVDAVKKADTGADDDGSDIQFKARTAYTYLGRRGDQKRYTMVRPLIASQGQVTFALEANVDFENREPTATPSYSGSIGSSWTGTSWIGSPWGGAKDVRSQWQSVTGVGHTVSLHLKGAAQNIGIDWYSTDWNFERGGLL